MESRSSTAQSKTARSLLFVERQVAERILETLDTPVSLGVYLRLKYTEEDPSLWVDIAKASVKAEDYLEWYPSLFADDYLAVSLLRKTPNLPTGIDRGEVALNNFFEAEEQCRISNVRLHEAARLDEHPMFFYKIRHQIRKLMGDCDKGVLANIAARCHFGPGSTVGADTSLGNTQSAKFRAPLTVTEDLRPFASSLLGSYFEYEVVPGERFSSVLKNALTDRGISPQPTVNAYYQLGCGETLKEHLRRFGFDITDQSLNQLLASKAHVLGLCTIDLSMASDLICREAIRQLVSSQWWLALDLGRSKFCTIGDFDIRVERFCSMGNGFTFPLQTALFGAILRAVVPAKEWCLCSAYGDDLICPAQYYDEVVEALTYLGLRVNASKSFRGGNFFESCGTDWFAGTNVRPFFLDRATDIRNGTPYLIQIANAIRQYAKRRGILGTCDSRYREVYDWCVGKVSRRWHLPVPASYGDVGLISSIPEDVKHGPYGFKVKFLDAIPLELEWEDMATVWSCLAAREGLSQLPTLEGLAEDKFPEILPEMLRNGHCHPDSPYRDVLRGTYGRPRVKTSYVDTWDSGYEWL